MRVAPEASLVEDAEIANTALLGQQIRAWAGDREILVNQQLTSSRVDRRNFRSEVDLSSGDAVAIACRSVQLAPGQILPAFASLVTVMVFAALLTWGRATMSERPTRLSPNNSDRVITR